MHNGVHTRTLFTDTRWHVDRGLHVWFKHHLKVDTNIQAKFWSSPGSFSDIGSTLDTYLYSTSPTHISSGIVGSCNCNLSRKVNDNSHIFLGGSCKLPNPIYPYLGKSFCFIGGGWGFDFPNSPYPMPPTVCPQSPSLRSRHVSPWDCEVRPASKLLTFHHWEVVIYSSLRKHFLVYNLPCQFCVDRCA